MNLLFTEAKLIFTKPLLVMSFLQPKAFNKIFINKAELSYFDYNYNHRLDTKSSI